MKTKINTYKTKLKGLISSPLDFPSKQQRLLIHNLHSFPAKYPPELPRIFINTLTDPGDIILDPMVGSGTTLVEACLNSRIGVGYDIDPLSILILRTKLSDVNINRVVELGLNILARIFNQTEVQKQIIFKDFYENWDEDTIIFINYWFPPEVQIELALLITEINKIDEEPLRNLLTVIFSSLIITKSGGVTYALDLAHTRPHKAKYILANNLRNKQEAPANIEKFKTKYLRRPLIEFERKLQYLMANSTNTGFSQKQFSIKQGYAQKMDLNDNSIDLIITSPPYASEAIDYM